MKHIITKYREQFFTLLQSKVIHSLGWVLGGNIANKGISFIGTIIVLRHLSTEGIALLYPLLGIFHIANQFGDFGVTTGFVKIGSQALKESKKQFYKVAQAAFYLKLIAALGTLLIGFIFASPISNATFNSTTYAYYVRIIFIASFCSLLGGYTNAVLQIQEKFKTLSLIQTTPPLIKFFTIVALLYLSSFSFVKIYAAYLIVPIMTFIIGLFFVPFKFFKRSNHTANEKQQILNTSKWIYISSLATAGYGQVDVLMVRSMLPAPELAHLIGGQKLSALIPIFTATLMTVLLPKVSSKTTKKELNFFFRKTLLFVPIVLGIFLLGIFGANFVIPLLLGEKYLLSISIFKYYLIGYALSLYITPTSLILYSLNKEHLFIMMNIFQFGINILGNYFLIHYMQADGAALTSSLIRLIGLFFILGILLKEGIIFYHPQRTTNS